MPKLKKLTDKIASELPAPPKGNKIWYEDRDDARGFGIRVTASGARSFILRYVAEYREYRYTIGLFGPDGWKTERARREAQRLMAMVRLSNGKEHPMASRRQSLSEHKAQREAETYRQAVEEYIKREQIGRKRNATADQVERGLLAEGKPWLDLPLNEISDEVIFRRLEEIRDGDPRSDPALKPRPYLANRFHAYLSTFFKWCASPGIKKLPASPMLGMPKPWDGEEARSRFFNDDELKVLWQAADTIGGVAGAYVKLAMLTGKRRSALVAMQWADIDDDWVWAPETDNRRRKRNKRLHGIPLPRLAQRILTGIRPKEFSDNPDVFPGRERGTRLHPGSTLQNKVRKASGVDDFFMHALRHTVETRLAELGVQPHIRDLVLDHAPARGSGAGYDHYHYKNEMREALETWAAHIEQVVASDGVKVLR
ncbi:tyrosine-type recombinase/integrase [Pseudooceanicola sp.]|uniref:tyrosine-type recombinase/integrase n=1 Tax=Pseudooceanicola sp. TaxID=1914328 RepID=UPI0035176534